MFTGQTYLLSSLFNNIYVDQANVPSVVVIVLPVLLNSNFMYVQGCGTHNTNYSIGIAGPGVGGIRVFTDNNGSFSDFGNSITVNTTYKYTYYTANNNPWSLSYNLPGK